MSGTQRLSSEEKALRINLDSSIYGSFNEIGAGQEVAANFFRAGGSSGTIAWTRSAYDMKVSDRIYGECRRYVCEERLETMLDKEFSMMTDMLDDKKPEKRFFAFCNTVESLNYHKTNQGHGWVGIKFQIEPESEPNEIILHVQMFDSRNTWQQEALGILGVNLVYAAYYQMDSVDSFLKALGDRLSRDRMEIDLIKVNGPDFEHFDNRLIALKLVKMGMTEATMFDPNGNVLQPTTALYKKNVLMLRGRFRPPTHVNFDMLDKGHKQFLNSKDVDPEKVFTLFELTLKDLKAEGDIDEQDYLDRVELLGLLGQNVMISNYVKYYKVIEYVSSLTMGHKVGVILGVYNLETIFDKSYYDNLKGGIIEAFGLGFGQPMKMLVYPAIKINTTSEELYTCDNIQIPEDVKGLYDYLKTNKKLCHIENANTDVLNIYSDQVIDMIKNGESGWEAMVPGVVANSIKEHALFDYVESSAIEG
jgi:hypothetical protein